MVAFYCDHNLSAHIADELRLIGHEATTAAREGLDRARDHIHLAYAAARGRVLLTSDKDFHELHLAWQHWATLWAVTPFPEHAGILVFEQQRWSAAEAARQIDALLSTGVELRNMLYMWTPSRGWYRPT